MFIIVVNLLRLKQAHLRPASVDCELEKLGRKGVVGRDNDELGVLFLSDLSRPDLSLGQLRLYSWRQVECVHRGAQRTGSAECSCEIPVQRLTWQPPEFMERPLGRHICAPPYLARTIILQHLA